MRMLVLAALLAAISSAAHARDAEGQLDLILSPSNTQPAIVVRGGTFRAALREEAALRLESAAGSFALSAPSATIHRGLWIKEITLSDEVPAGTYTLVGSAGETADRNYRAVVVLDAPPETYRIAVWSNLRVSADPQHPDTELYRVSAQINAGGAALVLVTGDLTASGTPEQFRLALDILNDCTAPTVVAPGVADFASGGVQDFLGNYPIAVPFGLDGILLCTSPRAASGVEAGKLHLERRRIRASRWSIGAAPEFDIGDLREQLTVLIDDPLDAVLGAPQSAVAESGDASPWGRADVFTVPPDRAALQWYTVTPQKVSAVHDR